MNDKRSHKNKRAAQAAEWFTKTMSGDLSPETGWQLRAWLAESPENRDAFEFLGAI
ncbi:MAG: FecR/PupR family sigma factor regulator, partial [Deltaproteobacteria bacterium]|nr:FecR/PupR family sigma factor regulator [Deltaproteobacteria bacterium]